MKRTKLTKWTMLLVVLAITSWVAQPLIATEDDHHAAETGDAVVYELIMDEFSFLVEGQEPGTPLTVEAGQQIKLIIHNEGAIFHEAMFGVTVNGDHGYIQNFFDDVAVKIEHDMDMNGADRAMGLEVRGLEEVELDPEMKVVLEFTVPEAYAGQTFEIGCFVTGHYEAGMFLPLVVREAALDLHEDEEDEHGHEEEDHHDDEHDVEDRDGDGIPDDDDYCPTFAGDAATNGC